jgi:uncharacterized protein Usg
MTAIPDRDFRAQLTGFSLTTVEILYRMPDHPSLLQSYIWQDCDIHPRLPAAQAVPRLLVAQPRWQALSSDSRT